MTLSEGTSMPERPPEEMQFRFLSGRLCLDVTATVGERWRGNFERVRTTGDLGRWIGEYGLLSKEPAVTAAQLTDFRRLREAIYRAAQATIATQPVAPSDERTLTRFAAHAPLRPVFANGRVSLRGDDPVVAVLSTVARDAIDLFSGDVSHRIRECASPECALLFVDASRPGQRRWCSSKYCGGRARAASYRARRRA